LRRLCAVLRETKIILHSRLETAPFEYQPQRWVLVAGASVTFAGSGAGAGACGAAPQRLVASVIRRSLLLADSLVLSPWSWLSFSSSSSYRRPGPTVRPVSAGRPPRPRQARREPEHLSSVPCLGMLACLACLARSLKRVFCVGLAGSSGFTGSWPVLAVCCSSPPPASSVLGFAARWAGS